MAASTRSEYAVHLYRHTRGTIRGHWRSYGVDYKSADQINVNTDSSIYLENCTVGLTGNNGLDTIDIDTDDIVFKCKEVEFTFANASQGITVGGGGIKEFIGCTMAGTGLTNAFIDLPSARTGTVIFRGCDFSGGGTGMALTDLPGGVGSGNGYVVYAVDMKLPTSGHLYNGSANAHMYIYGYNITTGTTRHGVLVSDHNGDTNDDTAIYRAAGPGVDGVDLSYKMVSNTNTQAWTEPHRILVAEFYATANPTLTVNIVHDAQGGGTGSEFNDDEFWIEVEAPAASQPYDVFFTARGDVGNTPALVGTGTGSGWTGTGGFTDAKPEEIAITVTGGGAGIHRVYACLAVDSTTVYVDSNVDIA